MITYKTGWKEIVASDEGARFGRLAEDLATVQRDRDAKYGEKARGLHRKPTAGFRAELVVRDDLATVLPAAMQLGPFTPSARWPAYVRLSNGAWERRSDKAPDVRGVALKLVGVPGTKVLSGAEEPRTHDFLLIQQPTIAARSADDFITFTKIAASSSQAAMPLKLAMAIGPVRAFTMLRGLLAGVNRPFAAYPHATYWSAAPYELGPAAVKYRLVPKQTGPAPAPDREMYRNHVLETLKTGFAWELQAQAWQDDTRTPIEDPTVEWAETDAPFVTLATLCVAPGTPEIDAQTEPLAFDPWHAVVGMRPLGAVNRARKAAYFASTMSRGAAPEPTS